MTEQADSNIVDVFKERLASPFLFTFFWVSCTWNWKVIYWFLYEPLKPSLKLVRIPFEWGVGWPILITVAVITVVPWINNAVEIIKQYAEHNLNLWLHKLKWKKMVTEVEYQKLVDEVAQLKEKQHKLINDNVAAQDNENQAKEDLLQSQEQISTHIESLSEFEVEKTKLTTLLSERTKEIIALESALEMNKNSFNNLQMDLNLRKEDLSFAKNKLSSKQDLVELYESEMREVYKVERILNHTSRNLDKTLSNIEVSGADTKFSVYISDIRTKHKSMTEVLAALKSIHSDYAEHRKQANVI